MTVQEKTYESSDYRAWELEHEYGPKVHLLSEPYLLTQLAVLCSPDTVQPRVNDIIENCYRSLLVRVFNQEFPRLLRTMDTRMVQSTDRGRYHGLSIDPTTPVVTVNIARAGTFPSHIAFHMLNQFLDPSAVRQDHLVMDRTTDAEGQVTGAAIHGSKVGGPTKGRIVIVPDPMGATGSSLIQALEYYQKAVEGPPAKVIHVHLIVTPEYIRAIHEKFPDVEIYAIRVDRGMSPPDVLETKPGERWSEEVGLNDQQYIVPGGGGFGEILNNSWV